MKYFNMEVNAGDKIQLDLGWDGMTVDLQDFTVEEFRFALGVFLSDDHRKMKKFTPLCELFCDGPNSEKEHMPHYGEYSTNQVPSFKLLRSEGKS